jgi:phenylacetate-CoA oxygenase PaaJ subunit
MSAPTKSPITEVRDVTVEDVYGALDQVNDPELPMSVVDMGMIYDVRVVGRTVEVQMSLTSTGCPMHDHIVDDVRAAISAVNGVDAVDVQVVWDPPWTNARITPKGREAMANWGIRA